MIVILFKPSVSPCVESFRNVNRFVVGQRLSADKPRTLRQVHKEQQGWENPPGMVMGRLLFVRLWTRRCPTNHSGHPLYCRVSEISTSDTGGFTYQVNSFRLASTYAGQ